MAAIGFTRVAREELERKHLCQAGQRSDQSLGRLKAVAPNPYLPCYQEDSRILTLTPDIRRLARTTQCYPFPHGRTHVQLYHVMEVSQVALNIALGLRLNPDLTEAIGLGHDIGKPPFGHAGEKALNDISLRELQKYWKHNTQGLKLVDDMRPLNLTFEVRDGIVCHLGPLEAELVPYGRLPNGDPNPAEPPKDILLEELKSGKYERCEETRQSVPSTYEGCVARMTDKFIGPVADFDDGVNLGLFGWNDLPEAAMRHLGGDLVAIINKLTNSIIEESWDGYHLTVYSIKMPTVIFQALQKLNEFNDTHIYHTRKMESDFLRNVPYYMEALFAYHTEDHGTELSPEEAIFKIAMMTDEEALQQFRIIRKELAIKLTRRNNGKNQAIPAAILQTLIRYYMSTANHPGKKKMKEEEAKELIGSFDSPKLADEFIRVTEKVTIHRRGAGKPIGSLRKEPGLKRSKL
ncbi:MAG: HD domain-containing protein [Candidatus Margulisiibacteriota bacterium]